MHGKRVSASLYGGRGAKHPGADDVFVSETLTFDSRVIMFNKITILMIHMFPLMLHDELLKIHTTR